MNETFNLYCTRCRTFKPFIDFVRKDAVGRPRPSINCTTCRARLKKEMKAVIEFRKENNLCYFCGKEKDEARKTKTLCTECYEQDQLRKIRSKTPGTLPGRVCQKCGKIVHCENKTGVCIDCQNTEASAEFWKQKLDRNEKICAVCQKEPADTRIQNFPVCVFCVDSAAFTARKEREAFEAKGICNICRKRPARRGLKSCKICGDSSNKSNAKLYHDRVERGACTLCGGPLYPVDIERNYHRCVVCRLAEQQRERRVKEERLQKGLCAHCGKRPLYNRGGGSIHCSECAETLEKVRKRDREREVKEQEERKALGLCVTCAQPLSKTELGRCTSCAGCRAHRRDLEKKREALSGACDN